MGLLVTLTDFTPSARFDGVAWSEADMEESSSPVGPGQVIETFELSPIDPDPTSPQPRNFTTVLGTLEAGWYRIVWRDLLGTTQPTPWLFNGVLPGIPDGETVREAAPPAFDWASYGYPAPAPGEPEPLDRRTQWAISYVMGIAGRQPNAIPAELVDIAEQAIVLRVMQDVAGGGQQALETTFAPWLKSFTAGSYSETRFSPSELGAAKQINALPALAELLWLLMTPEKRDEWLERVTGQRRPAGTFIDIDWDGAAEVGPIAWGPSITHPWDF